jgi:phosphoribosylformimino-5-aminoimidazole carboxamide ribotide isomerase
MTQFRPCIDLHNGKVKQIIGGSLRDDEHGLQTNFESGEPASFFARQYAKDNLFGGHVIQLGKGNAAAACDALSAYPGGLQLGGGVTAENAAYWLEAGASHVIVTSWLFDQGGHFQEKRLADLIKEVGRERIVIDLSCRGTAGDWVVTMNRWQTNTDLRIEAPTLRELSGLCGEFLVHAADVEGRCAGMDESLVTFLGQNVELPITYAGGARSVKDLELVNKLSDGRVDLTIGSALDIFGGTGASYTECVAWNDAYKR